MNNQLGIKNDNKNIIENNNQSGLIYILQSYDNVYKIGKSKDIKKRMKQYNVGRVSDLPIAFVYKTDNKLMNMNNDIMLNILVGSSNMDLMNYINKSNK